MPRENLGSRILKQPYSANNLMELLYRKYGVLSNPFPSAGQTSGHPRMPDEADSKIDDEIVQFCTDQKSHVIVVTASQGIGKTNLLNAYERWLRENLEPQGYFIIRYIPDPEMSFDPLIRIIFDALGEKHLKEIADELAKLSEADIEFHLEDLRSDDMKRTLLSLYKAAKNNQTRIDDIVKYAHEWLLGFRILKVHRDELDVRFRLDTTESKTRALRDLVIFSHAVGRLQGIFLLLDELEKQDTSLSKTMVLRYLSALRALIDALPQNLFLMIAVTTDALDKYRGMLPALKGRLANEVRLNPLRDENEALELYNFYHDEAKRSADQADSTKEWKKGESEIVFKLAARTIFQRLYRDKDSIIEGVRQRDFLNELHKRAQVEIDQISHDMLFE